MEAAVLRVIGLAWLVLAGLIVVAMLIMSPTRRRVADVVGAILILGGPGLLLVKLADDVRNRRMSVGSVVALLLLPISFAVFAGYACFVLVRTRFPFGGP